LGGGSQGRCKPDLEPFLVDSVYLLIAFPLPSRSFQHLWEFGDYGSILIIANDEDATDHVLYTTDEGLTWLIFSPLHLSST
jgi:hypothetical protein